MTVIVKPKIYQGTDNVLQFTDLVAGLTGATVVTFDVWQDSISGTSLISKSLGSGVTVVSSTVCNVTLSETDTAIVAGSHYCELHVTTSAGDRVLAAVGTLQVIDTRKYDA